MSLDEKNYGSDLAGNASTNGYLTYGADNAYGSISQSSFDTDWYYMPTTVGASDVITAYDQSFDGTASPGVRFNLRDSAGQIVGYSTPDGHFNQFIGTAAGSGYYVEVTSPSAGGYSLRASDTAHLTAVDRPFIGGDTIQGALTYTGQDDTYSVHLTAGTTYYATLTGLSLADPYVKLEDALDRTVLATPASAGQVLSYTPTATGIYRLHVSSDSLRGQGSYTLTGGDGTASVSDTTSNDTSQVFLTAYGGPVAGLNDQFVYVGAHNVNISTERAGVFLRSGSGQDALQVASGDNVLDGSTGSNFLVGGTGSDTFFIDDRNAPADIWSTLVHFHTGDAATFWGVSASDFALDWQDNQGATGFAGLTLHATAAGRANASMTIGGYNKDDLQNGRLSVAFGHDMASNSDYLYVHGN